MVEVASIVREVRLENVKRAVTVVIGHRHAHPCLLVAILAIGAAGYHRDIGESAVVVVVEQDAGLRVHGHINIRPSVVIEIIRDRGNGIPGTGLQDARLLGDVSKSSISVVVIKNVCIAW